MSALPEYFDEFDTIENYWHFDQLCKDLAKCKGRNLTLRETHILQGLLLGYAPQEINDFFSGSDDSSAIRNTLSCSIYPWIKELIYQELDCEIEVKGARANVWLERAGYRKKLMSPPRFFDPSSRLHQFETDQFEPDRHQSDIATAPMPPHKSNSRV
jgi:hypothetical protein